MSSIMGGRAEAPRENSADRRRAASGARRLVACALACALALAGVPLGGFSAFAAEGAADAADGATVPAGADDVTGTGAGERGGELPAGESAGANGRAQDSDAQAGADHAEKPEAARGAVAAAVASATGSGTGQAPGMAAGGTPAPNLSETVVVAAPAEAAEASAQPDIAPRPPALWALLYDTGVLVLSASAEPDPGRGNALGVWDASETGRGPDERPGWLACAAQRGVTVRRAVLAEDARLPEGAQTAEAALAAGEQPAAPAPRRLARWFFGLALLEEVEGLERLDTSLVATAASAFEGCASLAALDLRAWSGASLGADEGTATADAATGAGDAGVGSGSAAADATDTGNAADGAGAGSSVDVRATAPETPTQRMLAGCSGLAELGISARFGLLGAELPSALWEGEDAASASSLLLCTAEAEDVGGWWRRVMLAGGTGGARDASGGSLLGGVSSGSSLSGGADRSRGAVSPVAATLVRGADGMLALLLSGTLPSGASLGDATSLDSWVVTDADAGGVPWAGRAADIAAVRVEGAIAPASMAGWFSGCSSLVSFDGAGLIDMSGCRSLDAAFEGCSSLVSLDLSGWDTAGVRDFASTFAGCSSLVSLDLSGWDSGAALTMAGMFAGADALSRVTLGEGFSFGAGGELPAGTWTRGSEAEGDVVRVSAEELAELAGAEVAGTWVRLPQAPRAARMAAVPAPRLAAAAVNVSVTVPTSVTCALTPEGDVFGSLTIENGSAPLRCFAEPDLLPGGSVRIEGNGSTDGWEIAGGSSLELSLSGSVRPTGDYVPRNLGRISWTFEPLEG